MDNNDILSNQTAHNFMAVAFQLNQTSIPLSNLHIAIYLENLLSMLYFHGGGGKHPPPPPPVLQRD